MGITPSDGAELTLGGLSERMDAIDGAAAERLDDLHALAERVTQLEAAARVSPKQEPTTARFHPGTLTIEADKPLKFVGFVVQGFTDDAADVMLEWAANRIAQAQADRRGMGGAPDVDLSRCSRCGHAFGPNHVRLDDDNGGLRHAQGARTCHPKGGGLASARTSL